MRLPVLTAVFLLLPLAAIADEIDLTPRSRHRFETPKVVLRAEAGNAFAPFGYFGGCLSYLTDSGQEFELGAGGGFPGLQLGFSARQMFGQRGSFLLFEIFLAGNTRVNRGASDADIQLNAQAATAKSSLWTGIGAGFEQRVGSFDLSIAADLALPTASFSPHFGVHGGIGYAF